MIRLGQAADHDFDQPLGLLSDCHRRIEHFLGILLRVAQQFADQALSAEATEAVRRAREYFLRAAPRHTADEEESLFPRMREAAASAGRACEALERLEGDHQAAEALHAQVDTLLDEWLRGGALSGGRGAALVGALERLQRLYADHIHVEDSEVFPLAATLLSKDALAQVGSEMRARRGLPDQK